jgi:hypothetical protein
MRWITGITFDNYRAFPMVYNKIEIPPGHHLLIYGENGSGKSSLYHGLRDFFQSSDIYKKYEVNHFSEKAGNKSGSIVVNIVELGGNKKPLTAVDTSFLYSEIDHGGNRFPEIIVANKLKGFLDYRRLLQTHLVETAQGKNPNLFSIIMEELLSDHYIPNPRGGVAQIRLADEWLPIKEKLDIPDRRKRDFKTAVAQLPILDGMLRPLLTNVFAETKRLLNTYFKSKIDLDIQFRLAYDAATGIITRDILLKILYAGEEIPSYQLFLNEARLSALAICIYLGAIKTRPLTAVGTPLGGNDTLKVLFLDDIFIGLDTGNRIPLLEILQKEFILADYQLFISTYDRYWFETAKNWFETEHCSVKSIELFADDQDNNPLTPDIPMVVDPSLGNLAKAKVYFQHRDYPSSANWLRKACEAELKRIMPRHLLLTVDNNTDEVKVINKLDTLVNNFDKYVATNGLNSVPFHHFKTYKKILLNPLSHDDLETPHYAREIRDGIALVEELQKIKTKEIVSAKGSKLKPMKLGMRDQVTGAMHIYQIVVLENLQIIKQDAGTIELSNVECLIIELGVERQFASLKFAFNQMWIERGYVLPVNYSDFYNNIKVSNKKHLITLMQF